VIWLCKKNDWDKNTEKGVRFKIEETWDCLKQVTLVKRKSLLRNIQKERFWQDRYSSSGSLEAWEEGKIQARRNGRTEFDILIAK